MSAVRHPRPNLLALPDLMRYTEVEPTAARGAPLPVRVPSADRAQAFAAPVTEGASLVQSLVVVQRLLATVPLGTEVAGEHLSGLWPPVRRRQAARCKNRTTAPILG